MSGQSKWVIGIVSIVVVLALLACGIFFAWRYFFAGKPSVVITAPPSNTEVREGETLRVEATASGGSLESIELRVDDVLVNSATSPSPVDSFRAELAWQATGLGRHMVEVKAYNSAGEESDPAGIIIVVVPIVAEVTPTVTVGPEFETPTETPTATPTSPPGATPTLTSPPPTATPTLAPPVINYFTIDDTTITDGESTTLRWEFSNATESHLYRDDVEIESGLSSPGTRAVNPHVTRTFKLVVSSAAGSAEASVTLTVTPAGPPVIEFFTASPGTINAGDSSTLSWGSVTNATSVTIDQGIGGVGAPGSTVVSPASTTLYTMTAVGPGGTTTATATVTVNPAEVTVTLPSIAAEDGHLRGDGTMNPYPNAGDSVANWIRVAFVSFDISGIPAGATIQEAKLDLRDHDILGDPFGDLGVFHVRDVQYGTTLEWGDVGVSGPDLWPLGAPPVGLRDVTAAVQGRLDEGRTRFQLKLIFTLGTDSGGDADVIRFNSAGVAVTVTYTP